MRRDGGQPAAERDYWRLIILVVSGALGVYHLNWGLPNGNQSWAADALGPVTVLSVLYRSFKTWNSGWYYFKYALGYPFLLATAYVPYLGYLFVTGGWLQPTATYPYGFANPEQSLFVLALIGRMVNVLLTVGVVGLTYAIGMRLGDRWTARLSAWLVATAYPLVYYAHTTNVDTAYLFWLILALYCALHARDTTRWLPWAGLGFAAGMALATKEQGFAFLLPLPILAVAAHVRSRGTLRVCWSAPVLIMAATAVVTLLLANNALFNPLGFVARLAFLMGRPLEPTNLRLISLEFALFKGTRELTYVRQLWEALESALGSPVAWLAVAGTLALLRDRRAAVWLLVPALTYYYLALRGLELITLRYTLPLLVIAAVVAARLLCDVARGAAQPSARTAARIAMIVIAGLGLARAVELDLLLIKDPRYQAEEWIRTELPATARGEIYQKPVYLPRFADTNAVRFIPMPERTLAGIAERRPDFIVLSSVSRKSMSQIWNPDWKTTGTLLLPVPEAERLVSALEHGHLGYRPAAVFRRRPRLFRSRITSLAPEITVYVRD